MMVEDQGSSSANNYSDGFMAAPSTFETNERENTMTNEPKTSNEEAMEYQAAWAQRRAQEQLAAVPRFGMAMNRAHPLPEEMAAERAAREAAEERHAAEMRQARIRERRTLALGYAIQAVGQSGRPAEDYVAAAREFDDFLAGEAPKPAQH